jgi:hypothetical protein
MCRAKAYPCGGTRRCGIHASALEPDTHGYLNRFCRGSNLLTIPNYCANSVPCHYRKTKGERSIDLSAPQTIGSMLQQQAVVRRRHKWLNSRDCPPSFKRPTGTSVTRHDFTRAGVTPSFCFTAQTTPMSHGPADWESQEMLGSAGSDMTWHTQSQDCSLCPEAIFTACSWNGGTPKVSVRASRRGATDQLPQSRGDVQALAGF